MNALLVLLAYLVGSLNTGILVGRFYGEDIRDRDLPGASGTFRQYGPFWGVAVVLLDMARGALTAFLAAFGAPWVTPLAALAVVLGHNHPVFFGFRGGGGLATSAGFLLYLYPRLTLGMLALGLAIAGVYHLVYFRSRRRGVYPLPFAAPFIYLLLLYLLRHDPVGLLAVALMTLALALRGLQLLRRPRPPAV